MAGRPEKAQGGGAEAERKQRKPSGSPGSARNTMGMGKTGGQMSSDGSMGKHQQTGDGGASDFDVGYQGPPAKV